VSTEEIVMLYPVPLGIWWGGDSVEAPPYFYGRTNAALARAACVLFRIYRTYSKLIRSAAGMPPFFYRCPITRESVQGFIVAETPSDDLDSYVSVICLSCSQMHLVNFRTGKTDGEDKDD
jgi:hypothetical protein